MARQPLSLSQTVALIALAGMLHAFCAVSRDELDRLHRDGRREEIIALIPSATEDSELLWRLARAKSELIATAPNAEVRRRLAAEAQAAALRAKALAPDQAKVRLCVAIVLGRTALLEPPRERFSRASVIRDEAEAALALDPRDPVAWFVLGRWHYEIANLNGFLRTLAEAAFGAKLPPASKERALECFRKSAALDPRAVAPQVEEGRTLVALGRRTEAREILSRAIALPPGNDEDREAVLRGEKTLAELDR